jgi:hypothetical protein
MAGVAARYGETGASAFLLPLSVDGLVIVASVSLVEIAGRISAAAPSQQSTQNIPAPPATVPLATAAPAHVQTGLSAPPVLPSPLRAAMPTAVTAPAPATPPPERRVTPTAGAASVVPAPPVLAAAAPAAQPAPGTGVPEATAQDVPAPDAAGVSGATPPVGDEPGEAPINPVDGSHDARSGAAPVPSRDHHADDEVGHLPDTAPPAVAERTEEDAGTSVDDGHDDGSVPSETADAVAYWYRRDPNLHPAEIGARIGRSERTVRRYWPPAPNRGTDPVNGHRATVLADTFDLQ